MEQLIHLLGASPWGTGAAWASAIIAAIIAVWTSLEKYRKLVNRLEGYRNEITEDHKSIGELQGKVEDLRTQDKAHYDELKERDDKILEKIDQLSTSIANLDSYQKTTHLHDLKDKIKNEYYKIKRREDNIVTEKELESLHGLIDAYELSGGKNSFVHEEVIVDIPNWKVVSDQELNDYLQANKGD